MILFDIDGTLLRAGRQVRPLFAGALEEIFGTAGDLDGYNFAGKTDPQIVLDLLTAAGFTDQEVLARMLEVRNAYVRNLARGLEREKMSLLPGVVELLEDLSGHSAVCLGLLTGNWEKGGRTKLGRFDLNRFFPFGAFGEDGIDRRDLPPAALERARRATGHRFAAGETLIVGDTRADIESAHAHGLPVLAVATGWTSLEELEAAGADRVVANLGEAIGVLRELLDA